MGFVQTGNRVYTKRANSARIRVRTSDALGYITPSAIQSLVNQVTQQPAPSPTSTGANIYTTPSGGGSLAPSAPILPPSSPPIVYTAPVQPAPPPASAPITPPSSFTPPSSPASDQPPPPPPSSGGTSSSGGASGGGLTPYTGASVDVLPPSDGFLPETTTPPASAPALTLADKIAALPTGVKVGAALALAFFLFKRR